MLRVLSVFTASSPSSVAAESAETTSAAPNNNNSYNTITKPKKVQPAAPRNTIDAVGDVMPGLTRLDDAVVSVEVTKAGSIIPTSPAATPSDGRLPTFDHAPFEVTALWALGRRENWATLKSMLLPAISERFHVTDSASKAWVDSLKAKFDAARDSDTGMGVVYEMVSYFGGDDADMMKLILSLGVNPDLPKKHSWRPMHMCGSYARIESARELLLCRPDLTARNHHGLTPLEVARCEKYPEDARFPERVKQRPKIAALIEQYEGNGFPRLAELACKREWCAVKNLVRRQVVSKSELTKDKYEGKTAQQWLELHGQVELAQELTFYTKLCLAELKPGAKLKKRLKSIRMWRKKVSPPTATDDKHKLTPTVNDTTAVTAALRTSASAPGKLQNGVNRVANSNGHVAETSSLSGSNGSINKFEAETEI